MNTEKDIISSPDGAEKLISKKELLEWEGVTSRKLTYWHSEGVLSKPVLHKGQGGKSYYNGFQLSAVQALAFLQSEFKQSIRDIKRLISQMTAGNPNSYLVKKEPAYPLFPLLFIRRQLSPQMLDDIKSGKKIYSNELGFISYEQHEKSYIEKDGKLLKIINEGAFDPIYYIEADPIGNFSDEVVDSIPGLTYELDSEGIELWNERRNVFVELAENSNMLPPSYYYNGKVYYSNPDISCGAFLVCFAEVHGVNAAKRIVDRIREDINIFFHFPYERREYSASFLRFKKDIELVRKAMHDLDDIRLDGPEEWCDECTETFFEGFLEGRIRMKPNCIDNSIMFQGTNANSQTIRRDENDASQE